MGVEYAGRVSGVEFGSGVLEAPSEFYGVRLVVGVGKFGGKIGNEDWEHSVKVGFGEVRVGAPGNTDYGGSKHLLDLQALVGGKRRGLHLVFLCGGDVVEACGFTEGGDRAVGLDFVGGGVREYELFRDVEAVSVMEREGVGESRVDK